jgi:hypothetical protein
LRILRIWLYNKCNIEDCFEGGGSKGGTRPAHCKGKQQTKHRNMNFNERKRVPLGAANINVCIIKGDLTIEKVIFSTSTSYCFKIVYHYTKLAHCQKNKCVKCKFIGIR